MNNVLHLIEEYRGSRNVSQLHFKECVILPEERVISKTTGIKLEMYFNMTDPLRDLEGIKYSELEKLAERLFLSTAGIKDGTYKPVSVVVTTSHLLKKDLWYVHMRRRLQNSVSDNKISSFSCR